MNIFRTLFAGHKIVQTDFYMHTVHPPFTNGAMEYGFIKRFVDPLSLHTGTGYIPSIAWMVEQPPQVYASLAVPPTWIGGVPAGAPQWQSGLLNQDYSPASDYAPGTE
jgi:hypothetical protein